MKNTCSITSIGTAFGQTLRDSCLRNVLDNSIVQQIPIVSQLSAMTNGVLQIGDQLFIKKVQHFLFNLKDINVQQRQTAIDEIDKSQKYRIQIGEKLLYILEKAEDWQMAEIIALFFKEFIKKNITYEIFLSISNILDKISVIDLKNFLELTRIKLNKQQIESNKKPLSFSLYDDNLENIINSGLFFFDTNEITVNSDPWKEQGDYLKVDGGDLFIQLSAIGKIISNLDFKSYII